MRRLRYLGWVFLFLLLMALAGWIVWWGYELKLRSQWGQRAGTLVQRLERTLSDRQLQLGVFAESLVTRLAQSSALGLAGLAEDPLIKRLGVSEIILHMPTGDRVLYASSPRSKDKIWRATTYDFSRTNAPQAAVELTEYGARVLDIEPLRREGVSYGVEVAISLQDFLKEFSQREGVDLAFVVPEDRWQDAKAPVLTANGTKYRLLASSSGTAMDLLTREQIKSRIGQSTSGMVVDNGAAYAVMMFDGVDSVEYRSELVPSVGGASALVIWMDYATRVSELNAERRSVLLCVWLTIAVAGGGFLLLGSRYRHRIQARLDAAKNALRVANETLKNEVDARQRVEERLRGIADEMYAGRARDRQLLTLLAHRLKLNASATLGFEGILRSEKTPDRESLESLEQLGSRLFFMAENVDLWARQESLTPNLHSQPLKPLVAAAVNALDKEAQRKNIVVAIKVEDELLVRADSMLLPVALRNLLHNAIKFSAREGTVVVEARKTPAGLELSVGDSGVGIPREVMEKLFEPTSEKLRRDLDGEEGLGLGLVLVNAVARWHGAQLRITSDEGQGCRVSLTLPAVDAEPRRA